MQKINQKVYEQLTTKERISSTIAAYSRCDFNQVENLLHSAPKQIYQGLDPKYINGVSKLIISIKEQALLIITLYSELECYELLMTMREVTNHMMNRAYEEALRNKKITADDEFCMPSKHGELEHLYWSNDHLQSEFDELKALFNVQLNKLRELSEQNNITFEQAMKIGLIENFCFDYKKYIDNIKS